MRSELERAIALAVHAHAGQTDKQGQPYILHLLRVMLASPPDCRVPAVLHDLFEDTNKTPDDIRSIYDIGEENIQTVQVLTKGKKEPYDRYITRIKSDPRAVIIKCRDLQDNLDRIADLSETDQNRLKPKYLKALQTLKKY